MKYTNSYQIIKRCFDILFSSIGIVISIPIMFVLLFLLFVTGHKSYFFVQTRVGFKEKRFQLFKLKTMNDKTDSNGQLLSDEVRLTKIGKLIRKTSLDELPQLVNVIRGDMSIVGPRPLLIEYLQLYSTEQKKRHDVKPGITGWAQVNGRNAISWKQKFELDTWYAQHQSFFLDFRILMMTLIGFFKQKDINQPNQATVQPFNGNN